MTAFSRHLKQHARTPSHNILGAPLAQARVSAARVSVSEEQGRRARPQSSLARLENTRNDA